MDSRNNDLLGPDGQPIRPVDERQKTEADAKGWASPAIIVGLLTALVLAASAVIVFVQGNRDSDINAAASDAELVITYWVGPPSSYLETCRTDPSAYGCSDSILDERLMSARFIPETGPTSPAYPYSGTCITDWCRQGFQWSGTTTLWLIVENAGDHAASDISLEYYGYTPPDAEVTLQTFLDELPAGDTNGSVRVGDLTPNELVLIPLALSYIDGIPVEDIATTVVPLGEVHSPVRLRYNGISAARTVDVRRPAISIGDFRTPWIIFGG